MTHEFIFHKRKIIVSTQIQGINECRELKCILDTGASQTVINEDAVRRLGFELFRLPVGERLMTAGGGVKSKILKLPKISLFGKELADFEVNVIKMPLQITDYVDGLIGMDFLMKFNCIRFDFQEKTIETT